MRSALRLVAGVVLTLALVASTAAASHNNDAHKRMDLLFESDNSAVNSDLAFWWNHAFHGYYRPEATSTVGGFRIFDISNPSNPRLVRNFACDSVQADPIVWDRNGNGVADLMMLAVDRTMVAPACGAARSAHNDPTGWEGVRIFTMSDNPANPFATITQVKAVYTDCGAHTITAWPGEVEDQNKLLLYASSYPLRPGPTCGSIPPAGSVTPPYQNTANPYDEDPGSPNSPLHGVIQVIEVPLNNPAGSQEIDQQAISYPNDPDGKIDWCERSVIQDPTPGVCETTSAAAGLEPGAVACHDIVVHVEHRLAGAACAEQGQVWEIDENGIPDTTNPMLIGDDEVSSGGAGQSPGAVDFFHSVMFNNDGTVVNWVDESFVFPPRPEFIADNGCPPMTPWQARPWHPAGEHRTGRMFFTDIQGNFLSEFQVGNLRPDPDPTAYCSAHMGMAVVGMNRDLLVNAWYMGGTDVIDFSNPRRLREIAYYDIAGAGDLGSENWSAYPYTGPQFPTGGGIPVYATDGVHNFDVARGMVVFRADIGNVGGNVVDHMNPQTMDHLP
jgi:hypothetical protein